MHRDSRMFPIRMRIHAECSSGWVRRLARNIPGVGWYTRRAGGSSSVAGVVGFGGLMAVDTGVNTVEVGGR